MKTVRKAIVVCMAGLLAVCISGPVQGQVPGGPAPKWIQPPDMTPMGLDVKATGPNVVADDFEGSNRGPITNIQIWGSWLGDYLPNETDATAVSFRLKIYGDIPDPNPNDPVDWSTPGETVLW